MDICGYSRIAIYQKRKKVAACSTRESRLENTNGRMKPVSSTNKLDEKYANVQHIPDPVPEHMVPARKRQKKKKKKNGPKNRTALVRGPVEGRERGPLRDFESSAEGQ